MRSGRQLLAELPAVIDLAEQGEPLTRAMLIPEPFGVPPPVGEPRIEVDAVVVSGKQPLTVPRNHRQQGFASPKRQHGVADVHGMDELTLDVAGEPCQVPPRPLLGGGSAAAHRLAARAGAERAGGSDLDHEQYLGNEGGALGEPRPVRRLSLIHISEPTRPY